MDVEEEAFSSPGTETTRESTKAADASPDSSEPRSPRRGRSRRFATVVTPGDSRSSNEGLPRVLRARGAGAGVISEPARRNTAGTHLGRDRPAVSRSNNTPVMRSAAKKPKARKASNAVGPKMSRSKNSRRRPPTRAAACKPEAAEASSCGEESGALIGSNDNAADAALDEDRVPTGDLKEPDCTPKTKTRRSLVQQKEVKKEESEKEEEGKDKSGQAVVQSEDGVSDIKAPPRKRSRQPKDDKAPRLPKRRKKPPVQYVRCEIEGCGTVLAHPRYLQHHIKYQHLLKKKYVCDHPSCGRLFRLQKQLLRHAKHHTDQRDYICEYCARAFKSSHNLAVHRMIHTGEKPIQCEICGFTCRQKASLNWHMKKHDAEASYQFSCSICGRRFEKKDSVVAHKAKSHPEVLIAEALEANGGSVITTPISTPETVPVLAQPERPPASQEVASSNLTPLQQVVLPLVPQIEVSQGHFLQLPQQQAPALLHLTAAPPAASAQLIQLSALPAGAIASMSSADHPGALLTLSPVTTLASPAAQPEAQLPGEGELWERVVVGQEMMWEGNSERKKEEEGMVWEREGDRPSLLQCEDDLI